MNKTILIIDDNADIRDNTSELLSLSGYTTYVANDGKTGLEIARQHKPDLILCDIMMPVLDGYGVLRAIENIPELSTIPFIFFSAKAENKDFRSGMDLGADDYLTKPFSGDDLLRIVAARLKKSQALKKMLENNPAETPQNNSSQTLEDLLNTGNRTIKKLRKKDMLFMEGDSSSYLYYVVSGKIKTFKTNEWGKDYITEIYKKGHYFGHIPLFEQTPHRESASALENSEIALIPKDNFFKLLHANKNISLRFIKLISNSLVEAEEKLLKLAYNSARKRVAEALLFISKKYLVNGKDIISFSLNRENISALAGIAPESVSRNLTDLKEEGLICTDNGSIIIHDLRKLEQIKN